MGMSHGVRTGGLIAGLGCVVLLVLWLFGPFPSAPPSGREATAARPAAGTSEEHPNRLLLPEPAGLDALAVPLEQSPATTVGADAGSLDSAADDAPLLVSVRRADGEAAWGAVVLVVADGRALARAESDAAGRAQLPGWSQRVELFVAGASWEVQRRVLQRGRGEVLCELPAGASLAGSVRVNGRPPGESLVFEIHPLPKWPGGLSAELFGQLAHQRPGRQGPSFGPTLACDTDGVFRLDGLPDGWQGQLEPPAGYRYEESYPAGSVTAPDLGLRLGLIRPRVVLGRVLAPVALGASPTPAPGALVLYEVTTPDGGSNSAGLYADADGRFEVPLRWGDARNVHLDLSGADGSGLAQLDTGPLPGAADVDLGDLLLLGTCAVDFVVTDAAGEPIAGAIAVGEAPAALPSAPTDGAGRGRLPALPLTAPGFAVHALRHSSASVPWTPDSPQPVPVVLEPCASLSVAVLDSDGGPIVARPRRTGVDVSPLKLRFTSYERVFEGDGLPLQVSPLRRKLGVAGGPGAGGAFTASGGWLRPDGTRAPASLIVDVTDSEPLLFSCLRPGARFEVALFDGAGGQVGPEQSISLAAGEQREIAFFLPALATEVLFEVRDAAGAPVPGARVGVGLSPEDGAVGPTLVADGEGNAQLAGVLSDRLDVRVSATGRPGLAVSGVPIAAPRTRVPLVLPEGRRVAVRVVDAAGLTVSGVAVQALRRGEAVGRSDKPSEFSSRSIDGRRVTIETHVLSPLPLAEVTLVATLGERRVEQPLPDGAIEAELVLPEEAAPGGQR